MGFSSFKCAVSKQSIPSFHADGVENEDSSVVLVTPKGAYRGLFDGYGKLHGRDIGKLSGLPVDPMVRGMVTENLNDLINIYLAVGHDLFGAQTVDEAFTRYEELMANMKLVKAKYYDPSMTFESLAVSENCPYQGFFYPRKGAWNKPAYNPKKGP